jgi:hypothetical protein
MSGASERHVRRAGAPRSAGAREEERGMNEFMYLFRRPMQPPGSPQQMQALMERWQGWMKDLESRGHIANFGQPLDMQGAVVTTGKGSFNDGPYAETKDIVGGYTIVLAKDLEEAIALTKGHPVFDMGGMIEIRPVLKLS